VPPSTPARRLALLGTAIAPLLMVLASGAGVVSATPAPAAAERPALTGATLAHRRRSYRLTLRFSSPVAPGRRGWRPRVVGASGRGLPARLARAGRHRTRLSVIVVGRARPVKLAGARFGWLEDRHGRRAKQPTRRLVASRKASATAHGGALRAAGSQPGRPSASAGGQRTMAPSVDRVSAVPADQFLESVGVNTHLHFGDTVYANFPAVRARLRELGVRWIRDGMCGGCTTYLDRLGVLAGDGIKTQLIFGAPRYGSGWFDDNLAVLKQRLLGVVGAIEGPNEYDLSGGDPNWLGGLRSWQQRLSTRVKADPALRALPIVAPTVVDDRNRAALGDLSASADFGNIHPYAAGLAPSAVHMGSERRVAATIAPGKPVIASEAGYHTALNMRRGSNQPPVDERTQADYLPRLFLDNFVWGVKRTFSYELVDTFPNPGDDDAEDHFGLLRNDLSPKPAFTALRNLLSLVRRGGSAAHAGPKVTVAAGGEVRQLLLSHADGAASLVLWRDVTSWDTTHRRRVAVRPITATLRLSDPARAETIHPASSTSPVSTEVGARTVSVALRSAPVVIRLTPVG
jgi:hypothetical protein